MSDIRSAATWGHAVTGDGEARADIAVVDGRIAEIGPEISGEARETIGCAESAYLSGRHRRARALQRARAHRMGRLRHRHARTGGWWRDHGCRDAAQRPSTDSRRREFRPQSRGGASRSCRGFRALGRPRPRQHFAYGRTCRARRGRLQGLHVRQWHRRLHRRRRPDAVRGHGARRPTGPYRRRACRERRDHPRASRSRYCRGPHRHP